MSKIKVQCRGSGILATTKMGYKRGLCPYCKSFKDLTSKGRIKRHDRITTKRKLR